MKHSRSHRPLAISEILALTLLAPVAVALSAPFFLGVAFAWMFRHHEDRTLRQTTGLMVLDELGLSPLGPP